MRIKQIIIIGLFFILLGCSTTNSGLRENIGGEKQIDNPTLEECIKSPPQIYKNEHNRNFLDICGNKTQFKAIELKEHSAILYAETDSSEQTILRTISTIAPFKQDYIATLPRGYPFFFNYTDSPYELYYYKEKDLYFYGPFYGEMCGTAYETFIFSPTTKEFVSGGNVKNEGIVNCGETPLKFISNSGAYTAQDKEFTTNTYSEVCGPAAKSLNPSHMDVVAKAYAKGFPDKIFCFEEIWPEKIDDLSDPVGYFDLQNDKFVYSKK